MRNLTKEKKKILRNSTLVKFRPKICAIVLMKNNNSVITSIKLQILTIYYC